MKTLLALLFNLAGIAVCFLVKFKNRKDKKQVATLSYWGKDNWVELLIITIVDQSLLLLYLLGDIQINVTRFLPEWVTGIGTYTVSFLLGLGLSAFIYEIIKKKIKQQKSLKY